MEISPITRKFVYLPVSVTEQDGSSAAIFGVEVALLPYRVSPDETTVWQAVTYTDGVAKVLISGPVAGPADDALVVPVSGADLWARITDNPEIDAVRIENIAVI